MKRSIFAVLFFFLGLSYGEARTSEAEALIGITFSPQGISYQVSHNGCTSKEDFQVLKLESYPVQLKLIRIRPDLCRAYFPFGKIIRFSFQELGIQKEEKFTIANPLKKTYQFEF